MEPALDGTLGERLSALGTRLMTGDQGVLNGRGSDCALGFRITGDETSTVRLDFRMVGEGPC